MARSRRTGRQNANGCRAQRRLGRRCSAANALASWAVAGARAPWLANRSSAFPRPAGPSPMHNPMNRSGASYHRGAPPLAAQSHGASPRQRPAPAPPHRWATAASTAETARLCPPTNVPAGRLWAPAPRPRSSRAAKALHRAGLRWPPARPVCPSQFLKTGHCAGRPMQSTPSRHPKTGAQNHAVDWPVICLCVHFCLSQRA